MMKKIFAIALALCLIICAVSASAEGVLEKIKNAGVLVVGTEATYGPYEFLDDNANPIGCDIWLAQQIADELGVELKIQDMAFDGIINSVMIGDVDIGIAAFTVTPERAEVIDFTHQYELSEQVLVVKKGDGAAYAMRCEQELWAAMSQASYKQQIEHFCPSFHEQGFQKIIPAKR